MSSPPVLRPLDWNFSSCPPEEVPILFHYEYSRECPALRNEVEFMRHGELPSPTYWAPNPHFGWPEWPDKPYLSLTPEKRKKRLTKLWTPDDLHDVIQATVGLPADILPSELAKAIVRHVRREYTESRKTKGRKSYRDRLWALSVFRLRQHHSAPETIEILRAHHQLVYSTVSNLDSKKRRAVKYTVEFNSWARESISNGRWFPPFGKYLIFNPVVVD